MDDGAFHRLQRQVILLEAEVSDLRSRVDAARRSIAGDVFLVAVLALVIVGFLVASDMLGRWTREHPTHLAPTRAAGSDTATSEGETPR